MQGDASTREHKRFSPSQSERFTLCHGSTNLLARVPARPPTHYAIEGTKAHEVLIAGLRNKCRNAIEAHREHSVHCAEDLDTFDNYFYYSIQQGLDYVYDILDEYADADLFLERKVVPPIEVDGAIYDEASGYCDIAISIRSIRKLFVIDYKHGAGIAKAVIGNSQVKQYALGFLYGGDFAISAADFDRVVLVIIQPRAFHPDGSPREYECTPYEIYEYLDELNAAIKANLDPSAALTPGDDQCRFCDAATVCPAREAKALSVVGDMYKQIEQISGKILPPPQQLSVDRLTFISMHGDMLRQWLNDIDAHCLELAKSGVHLPGRKLVEVMARRKWYGDPAEVAEQLSKLAGVPTGSVMELQLIPITQAEKLVVDAYKARVGRGGKKQAAEEGKRAMAFLTLKQSSGNLTLVDEDDPRPAVNRADQTFGQIAGAVTPPT